MVLQGCDEFTTFDKYDITELLKIINDHKMEYRDNLSLPDNVTFGIEIETVGMRSKKLSQMLQTKRKWKVTHDKSIKIDGAEVISPILLDRPAYWKEIFAVCNDLKDLNLMINYQTAGHIHIGADGIINNDPEKLKRILKAWSAYENIIYRFSIGKWSHLRDGAIHKYAKPIAFDYRNKVLKKEHEKLSYEELLYLAYFRRYSGLNLKNLYDYFKASCCKEYFEAFMKCDGVSLKDTVEVRTPNATIDPVIWQNNINFFVKFFLAAVNDKFDDEKLNDIINSMEFKLRIINNELINLTYDDYEKSDLDKALELADIIFDNNLDKITFLKQYIGLLNNNFSSDEKDKAQQKTLGKTRS